MSENKRFRLRCAVYVFLIKDEKLFLQRRINTGWRDGEYGVPAGHLEEKEPVSEAVSREAKEEAGITIDIKSLKLVHTVHRRSDFDYIDLYFTAEKWTGEPKIGEPDKADDSDWFSFNNLPENMIDYQKIAFENYLKGIIFSEFNL